MHWSSSPHSFISGFLNYDFTTSSSMAFGNNMKMKGIRWTIYSGDINGDDFIDLNDLISTYNDAADFLSGYLVTDVNGDNEVDLSDLIIVFNNSAEFIKTIRL